MADLAFLLQLHSVVPVIHHGGKLVVAGDHAAQIRRILTMVTEAFGAFVQPDPFIGHPVRAAAFGQCTG